MKIGLTLLVGAFLLVFVFGCDRANGKKREEKNILQEYVETPLERAHDLESREDERTKALTDQLDAASVE